MRINPDLPQDQLLRQVRTVRAYRTSSSTQRVSRRRFPVGDRKVLDRRATVGLTQCEDHLFLGVTRRLYVLSPHAEHPRSRLGAVLLCRRTVGFDNFLCRSGASGMRGGSICQDGRRREFTASRSSGAYHMNNVALGNHYVSTPKK